MMNYIYNTKILALLFIGCLLGSCEKDIRDDIPKEQPRLEFYHKKTEKIFKYNSIKNNGKIWLSQPMYHLKGREKIEHVTPFHIALNLLDNNFIEFFVTHSYIVQTKSKDAELFNNLNSYKIGGEVRTEFTTLNDGILVYLKKLKIIDFDFIVKEYSKEKIVLLPFNQLETKEFVFKPLEYDKFRNFALACEFLYGHSKNTIVLKYNDKIIESHNNVYSWLMERVIVQYQDAKTYALVFRTADFSEDESRMRYLTKKMKDLKIDLLVPSTVTDKKVVLSSYGIESVEDGRYTLTIERD